MAKSKSTQALRQASHARAIARRMVPVLREVRSARRGDGKLAQKARRRLVDVLEAARSLARGRSVDARTRELAERLYDEHGLTVACRILRKQ